MAGAVVRARERAVSTRPRHFNPAPAVELRPAAGAEWGRVDRGSRNHAW